MKCLLAGRTANGYAHAQGMGHVVLGDAQRKAKLGLMQCLAQCLSIGATILAERSGCLQAMRQTAMHAPRAWAAWW